MITSRISLHRAVIRSSQILARYPKTPLANFTYYPTRSLSNKGSHDEDKDDKNQIQQNSSSKIGMLGSAAVAGSVLFGKAKYVFVALKITKLSSLASMLLSSAAYGYIFGWPYGIGMVGLIFVHECGHAIAMHHHKIPFTPMVFVPFMGASIGMTENPPNAYIEAQVALAGPILGSCAALSLGVLGDITDSQLLLALAHWGYMINLFNLLPSKSTDFFFLTFCVGSWHAGWWTSVGRIVSIFWSCWTWCRGNYDLRRYGVQSDILLDHDGWHISYSLKICWLE